jgi:hypothetical protein
LDAFAKPGEGWLKRVDDGWVDGGSRPAALGLSRTLKASRPDGLPPEADGGGALDVL